MRDLLRRSLDALLLRDDPFNPDDGAECECAVCTFADEVRNLTPAHIVAAILAADSLPDALTRASAVNDAVTYAVDTANHEWRMADPAVSAEIAALDALYDSPAFGEGGWSTDPS